MEDKNDAHLNEISGLLRCRAQVPGDEAFLWEVYASTRQEELDLTHWSQAQRKVFLDSQFKAMRGGYASQFPQADFSVILFREQPVGLMVVDRAETELRLVDIALLTEYRGRGLGSFLLKKLAAEAARARKPLRLHVFKGSRPWHLYERLGFVKIQEDGPYEHLEWRPQAAASPQAPGGAATPGD